MKLQNIFLYNMLQNNIKKCIIKTYLYNSGCITTEEFIWVFLEKQKGLLFLMHSC